MDDNLKKLSEEKELSGINTDISETLEHTLDYISNIKAKNPIELAVESSVDAFFVTSLEDGELLIVNHAFENFTGYKKSKVIGKTTLELNLWPHKSDRQLLVDELSKTGKVINKTVAYQHKNGELKYASISSNIVNIENKNCLINIARDITEYIKSKDDLEKYQSAIYKLYQSVSDPELNFENKIDAILQLCAEYLDTEIGIFGRLTDSHYIVLNLFNRSEAPLESGAMFESEGSYCSKTISMNKTIAIEHVKETEFANLEMYKSMGLETYLGVPVVIKEKKYGSVCFINKAPREKIFAESEIKFIELAVRWLTSEIQRERLEEKEKKYKEELSESKDRQHDLIELQPECVKTVSRSGDLIYMNAMGLKYIEANSLEEVKGACVYDLITDEFREEFIQMNERVFSGETVRMEFEVEGLLGTRRWMETNARPIINSKGEVIEHFAITRDISERKDSEIKLKTTTRALKVLNDCNHYITHVTNEIKLAHHICEVIVNTGGYLFSWIGYAQNEAGKLVKPIANAGYEQGYLENKITWGDDPSGCGPTGTCIKNNEATIVHNIGNDDSFSLWRDSALEHGYLSVVALPLSIGNSTGEADAALVLYSSIAASFDCYEVDLLSTLANNLSYAIRSIRTKNEKQKAEIILAANEEKYRLLVEDSGAIVWECSFPEIEYSYVSNATETILGYQAEDWYQPGFWQSRIYPEDKERAIHQCASQANEGVDHTFEYRMLKSDGSIIWIQDVVHVVSDENNVPVRLRGVMIDITEKKQFEIALKESEERFSYAMLGASDGLWDWNMEAGQVYFSLRWKSMLGFEEEEIENSLNSFKKLLHTDDSERVFQHVEDYVSGKVDRYSIEFRLRHKKEYYLDIHSQGFGVRNNNNEIIRLVGTHTDITDRKLAEKALISSETRFRTLYDETPAVFFSVNRDGYIISINEFGASHLGYKTSEIIGQAVELIFHEEDTVKRMLECFNYPEGIQRWESSLLKKQSDSIRVRQSVRVVNGIDDELCLFIICEDITETHRLSEELKYQATHDSLTSLVNRREFEKRLDRVLNSQSILFPGHAVCYMDLDNFKVINDTCGHLAGDALLKQLTTLLSGSIRGRDTLARLGGDEFAILMENCSLKQAIAVAEKILAIVEKFNFVWGENKFKVGVSIGLVPINDAGISVVNILSAADSACYVAKESGRNRIHIFSHDDDELEKRKGEMQWVSRINQALEDNLFCLFYQEVVSGKSSKEADKRRFEILLRIKTYDGSYILPGAFLPSAERYNLSTRIDEWVVAETLDWLTSDSSILDVVESCAINISGHSVCNEGFLAYCFNKIKTSGVSANKICFEITETAAIANLSSAKKFMSELGKEGCSFALDDFGSGLSSFGHLKSLPVDYIKIDGVFVRDIVTDPVDYEMVSAINRMGHVMNKKIIAEYVENDEISALLKKIGVDFIQGYGISKPKPIEVFLQV